MVNHDRSLLTPAFFSLFALMAPAFLVAQDPFQSGVRPTEPLSPAEEQTSFTLPPGFEIQLVASEPDILKPLNLAFDAKGRLWITESTEYPYAAPLDAPGRDNIKILEDADGDGRAETITTFADGLNIPIGLYPYHGGCIAFSIPHIWKFTDADGDDRAEQRERLYGPMGYDRDTHGLNNAFRRGFDGWLYACHGFNNQTTVRGADGHEISMQSGNTYRMRLDGSRIEQFTWGQVNPFGMTLDPLGNLFTADCHSKPLTQLLHGGYYPSFGKPHDGLGFVAPMMDHLHGSTAIAGAAFYAANDFPAEYRGNIFSGNVMTSRVNRNSLEYRGSTIRAIEEPDFLVTTDPWFRPVDVVVGPDGALYIADFYNRIIGHYEVPLDHAGRDRHRGRIWRVVYKGDSGQQEQAAPPDLSAASLVELIAALGDGNLTLRMLATDQLVDRVGRDAIEPARAALRNSSSANVKSHALWVLARLGGLDEALLQQAARDEDRQTRVHAQKALAETGEWSDALRQLALAGLADDDPFVRQAAADGLGRHPAIENVKPLLAALSAAPNEDTHLRHALRMALRDQLLADGLIDQLPQFALTDAESRAIADVAVGAHTASAGSLLVRHVQNHEIDRQALQQYLSHAARYAPPADAEQLAPLVRTKFADDLDQQKELFTAIYAGLQQRSAAPGPAVVAWAEELAGRLLASVDVEAATWVNESLDGAAGANPWVLQQRVSSDGDRQSTFICSLPRGEQLTGVLKSRAFAIPEKLAFYVAGHIGPPNQPVQAHNFIRLRDAASRQVLAEERPPRNDTAQRVEWDLAAHTGKQGYLEIVDGDQRRAYAWLAVGRFDPPVAPLPALDPSLAAERQTAAALIASELKLPSLAPQLTALMLSPLADISARGAAARSLVSIEPDSRLGALAAAIGDAGIDVRLRAQMCQAIAHRDDALVLQTLADALTAAPQRIQQSLAADLASDKQGAETLLTLAEQGKAAPRLLANQNVRRKVLASRPKDAESRIEALTASLPPENEATAALIAERRRAHAAARGSIERGAEIFAKNCANCHQLAGQGQIVGPQLDGIGNRGLERLLEDLLDPNRNVDVAFRTTTIITTDGLVKTGLLRREEGQTLVFADEKGEEFRIAQDDIDETARSNISLMPQDIAQTLPQPQFHDLLAFLLSQRGEAKKEAE